VSAFAITDAQAHIWAADTPERPWPQEGHSYAHRPTGFEMSELLAEMDAAGVARVVLVPPSFEGDRNDLVLAAARAHPERFAVMARVAVADPAAPAALDELRSQPGVLGLRLTFHKGGSAGWLRDGAAGWVWDAAARAGWAVMVFAPGQTDAIGRVAEAHPDLPIVVDGLGLSLELRDEEIDGPLRDLTALARHPNVAVKATALPSYVTDPYPFRSLAPRLERVLEAFGPRRVFWAGDLTRVRCTYSECVGFLGDLDLLSAGELAWVMGRGVSEWLRWRTLTSDFAVQRSSG
jgi:L-fuconolactonase